MKGEKEKEREREREKEREGGDFMNKIHECR